MLDKNRLVQLAKNLIPNVRLIDLFDSQTDDSATSSM